jgi:hypothetical protein
LGFSAVYIGLTYNACNCYQNYQGKPLPDWYGSDFYLIVGSVFAFLGVCGILGFFWGRVYED